MADKASPDSQSSAGRVSKKIRVRVTEGGSGSKTSRQGTERVAVKEGMSKSLVTDEVTIYQEAESSENPYNMTRISDSSTV